MYKITTLRLFVECVISFTKGVYNIPEDEDAMVQVQVASGKIGAPVKIRYDCGDRNKSLLI